MHEHILERWAAGEGAGTIAKAVGLKHRNSVHRHIYRARKRGDPRAMSHAHLSSGTQAWRQRYARQGRGWVYL